MRHRRADRRAQSIESATVPTHLRCTRLMHACVLVTRAPYRHSLRCATAVWRTEDDGAITTMARMRCRSETDLVFETNDLSCTAATGTTPPPAPTTSTARATASHSTRAASAGCAPFVIVSPTRSDTRTVDGDVTQSGAGATDRDAVDVPPLAASSASMPLPPIASSASRRVAPAPTVVYLMHSMVEYCGDTRLTQ